MQVIEVEESLLAEIDAAAEKISQSRIDFVREALQQQTDNDKSGFRNS